MKNSLLITSKRTCLLLILMMLGSQSFCQTNWTLLNPKPLGFVVYDASFVDANNGWAVGEAGTIARTTDGGTTWTYRSMPPFTGNGLTNYRPQQLQTVQFLNLNVGYTAGFNGAFLKTTDGGANWNYMNGPLGPLASGGKIIYNLYFFDINTGWAVGEAPNASSAFVYKTTDGGVTWAAATNVPIINNTFWGMDFLNPSLGYITGANGKVIKTTDGGVTWTDVSLTTTNYTVVGGAATLPKAQTYAGLQVLDANTIVISSLNNGCVLRTTNGGTSWYASGNQGYGIPQMSTWQMAKTGPGNDTLIIAGGQARVAKSVDRGLTWTTQQHYTSNTNQYNTYYAPVVVPGVPGKYVMFGQSGVINISNDGGNSWTNPYQSIGTYNGTGITNAKPLVDIAFVNPNSGIAVGAHGTLVTTSDGGVTWVDHSIAAMSNISGTQDFIAGVKFTSANSAYLVSGQGVIAKSSDLGVTWNYQIDLMGANGFTSMDFVGNNTGWASSYTGLVYKTIDGSNWIPLPSFTTTQMNSIKFLDANNGYIVGNSGKIFHTINGGTSWTAQTSGITTALTSVQFLDANNGFACGNTGKVLVTTDGGVTWTQRNSPLTGTLNKILFIDNSRGLILGNGGAAYFTPDAGISWDPLYAPTLDVLSGAVFPAGTNKIFVVGGASTGVHADIFSLDIANCTASIIAQPLNTSVCPGTIANFNVTVTGALFPTFQWQVSTNGGVTFTNIAGATASGYSFVTNGTEVGYQYRCLVTNTCGAPTTVTSGAGVLSFNATPLMSLQPAGNTVGCVGSPASINIVATGTGLSYQWQISTNGGTTYTNVATGAVYSGANTNTLTILSVVATQNTNLFRCVVTGICTPPVTSAAGLLTVPTNITSQPANITQCEGIVANFSVAATGTAITYQWQVSTDGGVTFSNMFNSAIYTGVTTATLTITGSTGALNNNRYRCVVNGGGCSLNSTAAIFAVNTIPVVTVQPVAIYQVCTGQNATINLTATGTAMTYQWQLSTDGGTTYNNVTNGGIYSNATTTALTITGVTAVMNSYKYRSVINGTCAPAATSAASTISISSPVVVSAQPLNKAVCNNSTANFSVTATGTVLGYQWQVSTAAVPAFTNIPGATTNSLAIPVTSQMNGNVYRCVIGSVCAGNINSGSATLTVNQNPVITLATTTTNVYPGQFATISVANVTPAAGAGYVWYKNGVLVPGANSSSIKVGVDEIGSYTVAVTDINGCTATSNNVVIDHIDAGKVFIYPNPSSGIFQVRLYSTPGTTKPRMLSVYDAKGAMVFTQAYPINGSYEKMEVNMLNAGSGVYEVVVLDNAGGRLAVGKVMIY